MTRAAKRWCLRGHDTYAVGRDSRGTCKGCVALRNRTWRFTRTPVVRLAPEPLRVYAEARYGERRLCKHLAESYLERFPVSAKTAQCYATHLLHKPTITLDRADAWCLALGTHLALLYPEVYELEKAAV